MKRWPVIILLVLAVLGVMAPGCSDVPRYDSCLAAADSMMKDNADSALALLQAIDTALLRGEGDRAYRDLLLTQARYKTYVTASSDSDINRALAYYRVHPSDREKLTRALIYKGAVMDELGFPDSAMLYYKQAEAAAAPDDYFNLGYAKMRIATLYQDQLSQDSAAIIRLKQAIRYFKAINDTNYLISCYGDLGGIVGLKAPDSAEYYLTTAINLALQSNSTKQYTYKSTLAGLYFYYYKDYPRAKDLAMDVILNGKDFSKERQFYYYAALSYIKMGMLDSAITVHEGTPAPIDAVDSMNRYQVIAEIKKAEKDMSGYGLNMTYAKDATIQVMENRDDKTLRVMEMDFDKRQSQKKITETTSRNHRLFVILCISLILISVLSWFAIHQRRIARSEKDEIEAVKNALSQRIQQLEEKKQQLEQTQCSISVLLGYRISAMNELFDSIKFKSRDENDKRVRKIIPLSSVIIDLSSTHHVEKVKLSEEFWGKMKRSVDAEFNGFLTYIENNYPNLTTKERKLVCLSCARVPQQVIKLCLDYTNVKSISNSINHIIKKKIGIDANLDEIIDKYMQNGTL